MRVRVKESLVENFYGFYGTKRRYPGDEFTLVATEGNTVKQQFSEKWMEKVEQPSADKEPSPSKEKESGASAKQSTKT